MSQHSQSLICLSGLSLFRGVRPILTKSYIAYEIAVWQGRQATVGHAGEDPLVIPSVGLAFINQPLPDNSPVLPPPRIRKDRCQHA